MTFAPSPPSRSHSHSRNASTPVAQCTPPALRARSGTVESSSHTFGTPTAQAQKVIARGYGLSPPPPFQPAQNWGGAGRPGGEGKHRKRPSPLRLQTTNLVPALEAVSPSEPTPTPTPQSHLPAPTKLERRRSRSTGDLGGHVAASEHQQGTSLTPTPTPTPTHRVSRSESSTQVLLGHSHVGAVEGKERDRQVYTPASSMLSTPASEKTVTAAFPAPASGTRFENVPLPWSTHPLTSLLPSLPRRYLPRALSQLVNTAPVILSPDKLASLSSEQTRLGLELDRLKVKHTKLSQYRDKFLLRLAAAGTIDQVQGLQSAIARVDRVARQIFICNDQIRQMDILQRDHEVGVLLWAIQGEREEVAAVPTTQVDTAAGVVAEPVPDIPRVEVTRATIFDLEPSSDNPSSTPSQPEPEQQAQADVEEQQARGTEKEEVVEILASPADDPTLTPSTPTVTKPEKPVSAISIALSPTNLGGFPLPPARVTTALAPPPPAGPRSLTLQVEADSDLPWTPHSIISPSCDNDDSARASITILPPDHESPVEVTQPEMPHTPMRSEQGHHHPESHATLVPVPAVPAPLPLRTRRSKPELSVIIPAAPSSPAAPLLFRSRMFTPRLKPHRGARAKGRAHCV